MGQLFTGTSSSGSARSVLDTTQMTRGAVQLATAGATTYTLINGVTQPTLILGWGFYQHAANAPSTSNSIGSINGQLIAGTIIARPILTWQFNSQMPYGFTPTSYEYAPPCPILVPTGTVIQFLTALTNVTASTISFYVNIVPATALKTI